MNGGNPLHAWISKETLRDPTMIYAKEGKFFFGAKDTNLSDWNFCLK